jgi:hypothetical protein
MPAEVANSREVLLKLLAVYQGANGKRADRQRMWDQIASFIGSGGKLPEYCQPRRNVDIPPRRFVTDLNKLFRRGLVYRLDDGKLEVTPLGRALASARALPPSLARLQKKVERLP